MMQTRIALVPVRGLHILLGLLSQIQVYLNNFVQVVPQTGERFLVDGKIGSGKSEFPDTLFDVLLLGVDLEVSGHSLGDVLPVLF